MPKRHGVSFSLLGLNQRLFWKGTKSRFPERFSVLKCGYKNKDRPVSLSKTVLSRKIPTLDSSPDSYGLTCIPCREIRRHPLQGVDKSENK
ncbi:MAG: hypothetical protein ACFFD4_28275 [Candidatus Odinarchaeota archaeon]